MRKDDHLIYEAFHYKKNPTENCEDSARDYADEMERKGIGQKIGDEDAESKFSDDKPVTNHIISQLRLMHDRLNEMSTAISLARSPEIDQLLSRISELADMLITEHPKQSEDAEMPEKDFIKLKQHINKGPIQIKKPSKELPYTNKYIHGLAKQDPREGQREENSEEEYSKSALEYAERIVGSGVEDPKALANYYLKNPQDLPEPLQYDVLKQNFEKILKYIDFTVNLNQKRKKEEEYKKKELARGPVHPDPEIGLPGSKQARYKPFYRNNPADYHPRQ